jgi:hypothetical protein
MFLVMELLDGRTLDDVLGDETRLPPARAAKILRHVLRGLTHAHSLGLVHRDLTPRNIVLVKHDGDADFAKVLDFGLARMTGGGEADRVTQTGIVCGTPKYMSPEQGFGGTVDQRSDLYAVSILWFEMLTGRPPFEADEPLRVLAMHATAEPPTLAEIAADVVVPPGVEALLRRGLAKERELRPANALEYLAELDRVMGEAAPAKPAVSRRSRIGAAAVIVTALFAAVLAMGVTRPAAKATPPADDAPVSTADVTEPEAEPEIDPAPKAVRTSGASLDDLRTLHKKHPGDPAVARALGDAYARRGWNQAAIDAYRDAVRAAPDDVEPALVRGIAAQLDSRASWPAAARLLRTIGPAAVDPVADIAAHHRDGSVRARAKKLLAEIR